MELWRLLEGLKSLTHTHSSVVGHPADSIGEATYGASMCTDQFLLRGLHLFNVALSPIDGKVLRCAQRRLLWLKFRRVCGAGLQQQSGTA